MKKSISFVLAFFIIFAPVYANAVLPALVAAAASSTTGRVLVGTTIKKVAPVAVSTARKGLVGICASKPTLCAGLSAATGLGTALISDGWTIDIDNNDTTNNIDVDIYKLRDNDTCDPVIGYNVNVSAPYDSAASFVTAQALYAKALASPNAGFTYSARPEAADIMSKHTASVLSGIPKPYRLQEKWRQVGGILIVPLLMKKTSDNSTSIANVTSYAFYMCLPFSTNKTYITNSELNQYITNNKITNNDILDIYNFDYSQYNNITIGGDTYNGDTINNELAKHNDKATDDTPAEEEKEVSGDLANDIKNNKYNIDDVNDENCKKTEFNVYVSCKLPTDPEPEPEKNLTCELEDNLFRKKVCEWMDWTQEKPTKSTETPIDIKDVELENSNKIDMTGECPAPYELNFNVLGFAQNHSISYQPLCNALVMLKPIFIGSGALSGMFILMGYSRPTDTGVN